MNQERKRKIQYLEIPIGMSGPTWLRDGEYTETWEIFKPAKITQFEKSSL